MIEQRNSIKCILRMVFFFLFCAPSSEKNLKERNTSQVEGALYEIVF